LGIAYKEMGLVNDAVGEFEIAMKSPEREVECCNMIAMCYQELGQAEKAIEFYKRGIEAPNCPPEAALNMNYELACVYETVDDVRNAALHFKKVVDQDKAYRDVAERIRAMKARVQAGKAYA
jgi:Tfp pilus assembly protein PilF